MKFVTSSCALLLMLMTSSLCDAQNSISEGPASDGKSLSLSLYLYVCVCVSESTVDGFSATGCLLAW